jgi:hypothetical protein
MSAVTKRWLALYLFLLLALSVVGAHNQQRYWLEADLIAYKDSLNLSLTDLRAQATSVSGTLAIRQWAYEHGMIPATEASSLLHVAPMPAPDITLPATGLEVRTLWR